MNKVRSLTAIFLTEVIFSTSALGDVPYWASSNTQTLNGKILSLVCAGEGPSLSSARENSQNSCLVTASRYLSDTLTIRSKSVETEKEAEFTQEVQSDREIKNLQCLIKDEKINYLGDQVQVFQKCQFDLSKVISTPRPRNTVSIDTSAISQSDFTKPTFRRDLGFTPPVPSKVIKSKESRSITLATVPLCDSVSIEGQGITKCESNPVLLTVPAETTKLLVKAKGHHPKEIVLKKENQSESLNVILEPF